MMAEQGRSLNPLTYGHEVAPEYHCLQEDDDCYWTATLQPEGGVRILRCLRAEAEDADTHGPPCAPDLALLCDSIELTAAGWARMVEFFAFHHRQEGI